MATAAAAPTAHCSDCFNSSVMDVIRDFIVKSDFGQLFSSVSGTIEHTGDLLIEIPRSLMKLKKDLQSTLTNEDGQIPIAVTRAVTKTMELLSSLLLPLGTYTGHSRIGNSSGKMILQNLINLAMQGSEEFLPHVTSCGQYMFRTMITTHTKDLPLSATPYTKDIVGFGISMKEDDNKEDDNEEDEIRVDEEEEEEREDEVVEVVGVNGDNTESYSYLVLSVMIDTLPALLIGGVDATSDTCTSRQSRKIKLQKEMLSYRKGYEQVSVMGLSMRTNSIAVYILDPHCQVPRLTQDYALNVIEDIWKLLKVINAHFHSSVKAVPLPAEMYARCLSRKRSHEAAELYRFTRHRSKKFKTGDQ